MPHLFVRCAFVSAVLTSWAVAHDDYQDAYQIAEKSVFFVGTPDLDDVLRAATSPSMHRYFDHLGQALDGRFLLSDVQTASVTRFPTEQAVGFAISESVAVIGKPIFDEETTIPIRTPDGREFETRLLAVDHVSGLSLVEFPSEELTPIQPGAEALAPGSRWVAARPVSHGVAIDELIISGSPESHPSPDNTAPTIFSPPTGFTTGMPVMAADGRLVGVIGPESQTTEGQVRTVRPIEEIVAMWNAVQARDATASNEKTETPDQGNGSVDREVLRQFPAMLGVQLSVSIPGQIERVLPDSPAAEIGLVAGQTIRQIGSVHVRINEDILRSVNRFRSGHSTELVIVDSDGGSETKIVEFGKKPKIESHNEDASDGQRRFSAWLGLPNSQRVYTWRNGVLSPMESATVPQKDAQTKPDANRKASDPDAGGNAETSPKSAAAPVPTPNASVQPPTPPTLPLLWKALTVERSGVEEQLRKMQREQTGLKKQLDRIEKMLQQLDP